MIFTQIKAKNSDNFSYIIGDDKTLEVIMVDPSYNAEQLITFAKRKGRSIKYVINTHSHRDHTLGNSAILKQYNAKVVTHIFSKAAHALMSRTELFLMLVKLTSRSFTLLSTRLITHVYWETAKS
jgi:glyoxylase-like metal-dependent hydrolase (beta-lactamase superfamily II)